MNHKKIYGDATTGLHFDKNQAYGFKNGLRKQISPVSRAYFRY